MLLFAKRGPQLEIWKIIVERSAPANHQMTGSLHWEASIGLLWQPRETDADLTIYQTRHGSQIDKKTDNE